MLIDFYTYEPNLLHDTDETSKQTTLKRVKRISLVLAKTIYKSRLPIHTVELKCQPWLRNVVILILRCVVPPSYYYQSPYHPSSPRHSRENELCPPLYGD